MMFFPELELQGAKRDSPLLRGRFIMPPFSVFDARQGYWQDRKRAWIALGIKSEIGRGENLLLTSEEVTSEEVTSEGLNYYRNRKKEERLSPGGSPRPACDYSKKERGDGAGNPLKTNKNGLLGNSEQARSGYKQPSKAANSQKLAPVGGGGGCWIGGPKTESTERFLGAKDFGTEGNVSTQIGTSIFDPVLCEILYRWFVPAQGIVLDPFAGGSVRGVVANYLGLHYTGIDLSGRQLDANKEQAGKIIPGNMPTWICGDSNQLEQLLPSGEMYDFVFSCPPYHDLEVYSDSEFDLSAMDFQDFVGVYASIIRGAISRLKQDRFAAFVVGEIRDKKTGFYKNFVGHTIQAFEAAGASFYNEAVLITAVGSLPIRTSNYFRSRKLGKTHQTVLVFYKGDPSRIKENFPESIE